MQNKLSKYLLIALIISLGFGQLLRFEIYDIPLYLHDILIFAILLHLLPACLRSVLKKNSRLQVTFPPRLFLAGITLGWIYALTQYSIFDILIPFLYTIRLLSYLSLYYVIIRSKLRLSSSIFLLSGITTLSIGLIQYFLLPDMRIFQYLGWDDHLFRLTLPHYDPGFTAVMLGLALLTLSSKMSSYWLYTIGYILGILLTYSRSVWLSLIVTAVSVFRPKKYLFFLVPILLVAILLLPKRLGEGTNLLRTYSIESRIRSDLQYLRDYKYSLLVGRGLNTLILDQGSSLYPNHASGPNNSYLYILATTGLMGLVGWGMFMSLLYLKSSHKPMLLFFFIASLFNNVMFYPFALLWVLLVESNT